MICRPHSSPNIVRVIKSKRIRWAGRVARMVTGEVRAGAWWGDLRETGHLGRITHGWEDNTKVHGTETGWEDVGLFHLAQDRDR